MRSSLSIAVLAVTTFIAPSDAAEKPRQVDVFVSGKNGYDTFRIPAIIKSKKGTLLAFCEGRKNSRSDTGNIDLVLKRSTDNGKTWGPLQVVADFGPHTIGNPCPVVDRKTGTIWLPLTKNLGNESERVIQDGKSKENRTVWLSKSTDDGKTWSKPIDISAQTRKPNWTWYATGPGVGIQLKDGRLVIPCDHRVLKTRERGSHVIYSDDHGKTWHIGGRIVPDMNECQVVELADGRLLMNMRSYQGKRRRAIAISKDGGITWSKLKHHSQLIEPVCQASLLRYTLAKKHDKNRLLFSNPASTSRNKMTVRLSYDEGKTWPVSRLLWKGPAAYSNLVVLPDHTIGCLYERGKKSPYEKIAFARFTLDWLASGKDSINTKN